MRQWSIFDKGRGGNRNPKGRPPVEGSGVSHSLREWVTRHDPVHVTLSLKTGLPPLREDALAQVIINAIDAAKGKHRCGIVHYCVLNDHVHLIVEAPDKDALASAMNGLSVRIARGLNRELGRKGKVFSDRYHARYLRTPSEAFYAVRYVLLNARKHGLRLAHNALDALSSARWFPNWSHLETVPESIPEDAPVSAPTCWKLTEGLLRFGPINPNHYTIPT